MSPQHCPAASPSSGPQCSPIQCPGQFQRSKSLRVSFSTWDSSQLLCDPPIARNWEARNEKLTRPRTLFSTEAPLVGPSHPRSHPPGGTWNSSFPSRSKERKETQTQVFPEGAWGEDPTHLLSALSLSTPLTAGSKSTFLLNLHPPKLTRYSRGGSQPCRQMWWGEARRGSSPHPVLSPLSEGASSHLDWGEERHVEALSEGRGEGRGPKENRI